VHIVFLLNELLFYKLNTLIYLSYKVDSTGHCVAIVGLIVCVFIDVGGWTLISVLASLAHDISYFFPYPRRTAT